MLVLCSACSSRLKIGEHLLGKRIKCPSCGEPFVATQAEPAAANAEAETHGAVSRPAKRGAESGEGAVTESPRSDVKPPPDDVDDDSAEDETVDDRPRKKKKKKGKKKAKRNPAWVLITGESMPLFLFGGGGVVAVELLFLASALFLPSNHPSKFFAAYLFVMVPISTLIFFGSMYLSSLVGTFEIGEIPIAMIKGFFLILVVSIVSLIPFGFLLTALLWFGGIMTLFRLDVWEARVLIGINWVLNLIAQVFIVLLLASILPVAGGPGIDDDALPEEGMVWDADTIKALGGRVGFVDDDENEVFGISLANRPIHDLHLAHMKDFPRLARLDLTNTPITDRGLTHLRDCPQLEKLTLNGTRVTDAGVKDLRRALPKCVIQK
jgi:hypothetical protein